MLVWEAATGRELLRLPGPAQALAFAPDGSLLAAGTEDGDIRVWSIADGARVHALSIGEASVLRLAFGPQLGGDFRAAACPAASGAAGGWRRAMAAAG